MTVNEWFEDFCGGDQLWNSDLTWNTTSPELTSCFRQTILIWIPAAFLWFFAPLEGIFIARSRARLIPWNAFNVSRIISVGICILISLSDCLFCIYRYAYRDDHPPASDFCAPFISFATFLLLEVLLIFHRWRGIHTSGVVWIFALLALTFGAPTLYIYCFLRRPLYNYQFISYLIYYSMVIILFLLSCFADSPPKYNLTATESEQNDVTNPSVQLNCPEIEASFLSKMTYWWFNGLAITGFRKGITGSDLWDLKIDDKTNTIAPKFDKNWLKQIPYSSKYKTESQKLVSYKNNEATIQTKTTKPTKTPGTIKTLIKTFGVYFLSGAVFKLFHDLLQFVSPQLLKILIAFVSKPSEVEPVWHGYFIAFLLFLTAMLQSVMLNYYFQVMFVVGMRVRTALISAIYRKSLNLSNSARKGTTSGEVVNLMSVDAQRFVDLLAFINLVWSAPLQIVLAMYFLWLELGPSVLAGLLVMILMLPINAFLATYQKKLQMKQMKQKDERVKIMNEILSGIRVIKLYAWEKSFINNVFKIRNIELTNLKNMAYFGCVTTFLWTCAPFLVALVTFAIYVLSDETHVLDAQKAFVSLALFNLLRFPLTMLPQMITFIVMTSVSVKRLNKFFNSSQLEKYVTRNEEMDAIVVESGTFTWETKDESETEKSSEIPLSNTLIDINLHIQKGSLVAVVGSVGSGKSSLISALLGEMDHVSGRVNISGSLKVAYIAQQAWIQNSSLRNNILFGMKYNKQKYESIIKGCALGPDLAILPGGDETEIGEKGINLSGGQKQRVSIARACYSDSDVILMDDPLSAVDSHVAKHIFEKVLSNKKGILKDKTRLFVTNNLSFLPEVDSIVVLKNGRINEIGTYSQLMENKKDFSEFINEFSVNHKESNGPLIERQESVISEKMTRSVSIEKDKEVEDQMKLIESEKTETGKVKFSIYIRYFKSLTIIWLVLLFVGMIGMQIASVGSNVWLAFWSNDKPINGTQDEELRNMRLSVYGLLGAAQAFLVLLAAFAMAKGTVIASRTLHNDLLERILRAPLSFFDTTPLGRIVNRFSKDIDTVDATIPHTIRGWLLCLLQVLSTFILIGFETPMFLVVILPVALLYYFIQKFYVSTSRQLKRLESVTRSPIYSHFSETLSGVSTIRAYGSTRRFIAESNNRVDYNQVCYYPSVCANRWLAIRLELCGNCITLFAAIFAVLGREKFRENPGFVGLIITYALSVTQTLNWLVRMTSEVETNIVSVERIAEYCDNPTEAEWYSDEDHKPPKDWPTNGKIEFVDYSVRYRTGLDLVLRNIATKIDPEEKIGIVGRTGAGKSSLTLCLFRIIEAADGKIVIDDIDISQIGLRDLRSRLTIIPQDPVLFSGTIRSNLDPFESYTDDQIWTALEHSHLKHYVKALDSELEYKVSEGGENLSVGQRQLICLARALLRKSKILVLDEATAAVDLETDSLIQTTIRKEFKDCTILTIAHRLNTIMDSNRILVLDKGSIGEFDSPTNLLSNQNSLFYSLAKDARIA